MKGKMRCPNDGDETPGDQPEQPQQPEPAYWFQIFQNLYASLSINPELVDTAIDWIDADETTTGTTGAEDFYYTGLTDPYRTGNQPLASMAELPLMKGYTSKVVEKLLPWLSALPLENNQSFIPVNVNTAAPEILALFSESQPFDPSLLEPLIQLRETQEFTSLDEFRQEFEVYATDGLVPGFEKNAGN